MSQKEKIIRHDCRKVSGDFILEFEGLFPYPEGNYKMMSVSCDPYMGPKGRNRYSLEHIFYINIDELYDRWVRFRKLKVFL